MKRRKAIATLLVLGGGAVATVTGYKAYRLFKAPELDYLENHKDLLDALAEAIIPATDTPGAREAGVGSYIITALRTVCDKPTQNNFIYGLKEIEDYCGDNFSCSFTQCDASQQKQALVHMQEKGKPYSGILGKVQKKYMGGTFFTTLKELTVYGYCTSKPGAQQGLAYDYIPGAFKGCIPLAPGQKSWATK